MDTPGFFLKKKYRPFIFCDLISRYFRRGYPRIFLKKIKNPSHLYFHMVYFLDVGVDYNHVINDVVCPQGILGCLANTGPKCLLSIPGHLGQVNTKL